MKKIIAITLLICMVFGSFAVTATEEVNSINDYSKELFIFEYLGALGGQTADMIDTESEISRGEFVRTLASALKLSVGSGNKVYYDVDNDSLYFDAVSYLVDAKVLSVGEDRLFRTDDGILYSEALKILLSLAGYDEYISVNGGYPLGYLKAASRFETDLDKDASDVLTYGEAMELMLDVMNIGIYDLEMISDDSKQYTVNPTETLLSVYRDLYINRGTVETTVGFSMTANIAPEGKAFIDGVEYKVYNKFNIFGYEGNYVEYYYKENEDTDELVYAEKIQNKKDISITSEEYVNFSPNNYTLTYYTDIEKGKKNDISIDKKWTVVYNGRSYDGSITEIFEDFGTGERKGSIEIKRSYDNSNAVLIIKSYRRYIVRSYDKEAQLLYNKFETSDTIALSNDVYCLIRKGSGEKVHAESIVPETALLIAESADKKFVDIVMPEKEINITIKSIREADRIIKTENEEYIVDAKEWERVKGVINIGSSYSVIIDAMGEIAYMSLTGSADGMKLGYIAAVSITSSFGTPDVSIKLLTETEGLKAVKLADRVTVDGISYTDNKKVNALYSIPETEKMSGMSLSEGIAHPESIKLKKQLIRYRTNSEGKITYIDTYNVNYLGGETKDTSLTKYVKRFEMLEYRQSTTNRFDRDVLYSPQKTKTFTVPWTDDEGYMIKGVETWKSLTTIEYQMTNSGTKKRENDAMYSIGATFTDFRYYNIDVYNYDANNPYADVIVHNDDFIGGGVYGQVKSISQAMDDQGNIGHEITVIGTQGEKTFFIELDTNANSVKIGDIIYGEYYGTYIHNISKIFDCETRKFIGSSAGVEYWYKGERTATTDTYRQQNQFSKGTVVKAQSGCAFWKYEMHDSSTEYDEVADLSLIKFTVYDRNGKGEPYVEAGTTDRLREYSTAGDDCSYIVCLSDLNRTLYAFVFNGR